MIAYADFIKKVVNNTNRTGEHKVSQAAVRAVIDGLKETVMEIVSKGYIDKDGYPHNAGTDRTIRLPEFVSFEGKDVAERTGRNPKTGESVVVPAHKAVTVKLSKHFKDAIR